MAWKFAIAMLSALAFSAPAFATGMTNYTGHHACASGGKKGGCMEHHYTGHHACASGDKKGGCMTHHSMGHHASPSGDKKSGAMH
ncbi:hypothetical protein CWB41_00760 [Methylovirgula ligni]|uniref:Uncharacterized protein n=1 Tax=Methylovirgula ligni TaxID=569860 RepID=A0A3D9YYG7_9HYPH|nr:hypothetical protein [Methylovirgula ligni]QAY94449.1 hypothetical protein CWB41_00760 [Methylovirgula ligni]REF87697.1 hypothetical protein DES32_1325 [Methylovirgula ligni]